MKHCAVCGFSFLKLDAMPDGSFTLRFYCPGCPLSHVAAISLEIKSIDDLARACKRLGLELVRDQKTYRWWGRSVGDYPLPEGFTAEELGKCQHAITIPGTDAYEVGVVNKNGKWHLLWDFYGRQGQVLQNKIGKSGGTLKQAYAIEAATTKARQRGFGITEKRLPNGQIQLVCTKG